MANYLQLLLALLLLALYSVQFVNSMPYDKNIWDDVDSRQGRCTRNEDVDVNCQRCAKATKSPIVYPMCCKNKDDVYQWCTSYINYGLQKRGDLPPLLGVKTLHTKEYNLQKDPIKYYDSPNDLSSNSV